MPKHPTFSNEAQNRVWIEIERHPTDNALNKARAEAATRMIQKLGPTDAAFWYSEREQRYNYTHDASGTYTQLTDNGHWFNLDYFGRE